MKPEWTYEYATDQATYYVLLRRGNEVGKIEKEPDAKLICDLLNGVYRQL